MIVVRNHELASPQLFGASGISSMNPLGLGFAAGTGKPTYLLDMNVLFDLGPRRRRRNDVVNLFRAERMQVCSLAISSEIRNELARSCPPGKTDPMQDFASILPAYPVLDDESKQLTTELEALVFRERSQCNALTPNDRSDLKHLATAIIHGLEGLVTSDATILGAAADLRYRYGIDVLSPSAFTLQEPHPVEITAFGTKPDRVLAFSEAQLKATPLVCRWWAIPAGRLCRRSGDTTIKFGVQWKLGCAFPRARHCSSSAQRITTLSAASTHKPCR